jgi:adenylate cyclase
MQQLVDRFESVAADVVVDHGGRVVKTIGDEVMFATAEVVDGAAVAVDLAAAFAHEPDVPDVRVGLACGPVLSHHGDLYGPVVNLAARAVAAARPGTVLVSEEVATDLDGVDRFATKPLRRRKLKGLGTTPLHVLRPASAS